MTTVLVAEDEDPQRRAFVELLGRLWPEAEIIEAADGPSAVRLGHAHQCVAAFLDLRMPALDGLGVAAALPESTHVVFVTAHADEAVAAFERGAIDYLLKPVAEKRLAESVRRLRGRLDTSPASMKHLLAELHELRKEPERLQWVTASVGDTVRLCSIDEILAFRAQDKYTEVLSTTGDATIRMSLKELLSKLDPDEFWQVHRSVIVRVSAIEHVRKDADGRYSLTLKGRGDVLPIANSFRRRFRGM
ncbi:MAG: LytTR family DNA-binding domain-containing protein [Myxococcota bacterium]